MNHKYYFTVAATFLAVAMLSTRGLSQDPQKNQAKAEVKANEGVAIKDASHTQRVSKLVGMEVHNAKGENLGEIKDLVMDLRTGQIRYAALSFGGFLGVGDKLFAVPLSALKVKHDGEDTYFVLNVEKERLKTAPGFNESAWPDFGNAQWIASIDAFYGGQSGSSEYYTAGSHSGKVVSAGDGKLVMVDQTGKNQHSHIVGADVRITLDGKEVKLNDLRKDHQITVKVAERDGKPYVTMIEAHSTRR